MGVSAYLEGMLEAEELRVSIQGPLYVNCLLALSCGPWLGIYRVTAAAASGFGSKGHGVAGGQ